MKCVATALLFLWTTVAVSGLTVTLDDNYPPFSFRDATGRVQGISIDLWNLWSQKTGVPVTIQAFPWLEALKVMARGDADVLDTVFETPDRDRIYRFTSPYATIRTAVFVRVGSPRLLGPQDLGSREVGVKRGDAGADALRSLGKFHLREYSNYSAIIRAAARGDVSVFCMDVPPAEQLMIEQGVMREFSPAFILSEDSFRRAVARGDRATFDLVQRGFSLLSAAEVGTVFRRWMAPEVTPEQRNTAFVWALTITLALAVVLLVVLWLLASRWHIDRLRLTAVEQELKKRDDWVAAVTDVLPDALLVLQNDDLRILTASPGVQSLFKDEILGQTSREAFGAAFEDHLSNALSRSDASGTVASFEMEWPADGASRTVEGRVVRIQNERILVILRDMTARRRQWKADLDRNKAESLSLMAGGLAHDFNNSLGVIQGFVSLAKQQGAAQGMLPKDAEASLEKALTAARRAAGLTAQLRVLAHGSQLVRQPVSLRSVAEEAASFALVGSPCTFEVRGDSSPLIVEADLGQMTQVFQNLALNAVQAMPEGGLVTLLFTKPTAGWVKVSVVDEGEGVPPENAARIFDPYFTTKSRGSGLGLPMVRAIVERHGGALEWESRPGEGSVFSVSLPLVGTPETAPSFENRRTAQASGVARVLVMEDIDELRDLYRSACESAGWHVEAFREGQAALQAYDAAIVEGEPFSLVVTDLLVPDGMGGRELAREIRKRTPGVRILGVTGYSAKEQQNDDQVLFSRLLYKPFTIADFVKQMREVFESPHG